MANRISQTNAIIWSSIERFSGQGIQFVLSIVIARLLSPSDYGLIAMLTIFLALAQTFIDSGFTNALIQKKDRTEIDFSTVLYFNIVVAVLVYVIFFITSPFIAAFYNQPILTIIARFSGLNIIISSLAIVQRTKLTINLDFKTQTKISLLSVITGGTIGIYFAWKGIGVWALVIQSLVTTTLTTILLWTFSKWKPLWIFSLNSFKSLFAFGSKILITGLLSTIYSNLYSLVIGKYFSSIDLGNFNRMTSIASFPSKNLTSIISRVVYPIQCKMQDDNRKLTDNFLKLLSISSYIIFPVMTGIAVLSQSLIYVILSSKWLPAAPFLSVLCIAFMWDHIMFLNWQLLGVKGRSDLSLKSEIIKKCCSIIILFATIPFGVTIMSIGLVGYSLIDMIIIIPFVKKVIPNLNYAVEIKSILFPLLLSFAMGIVVFLFSRLFSNQYICLFVCIIIGFTFYLSLSVLLRRWEYKLIISKFRIQ
jgi:O-antigen/teichoic acid export membrane protein